MSAADSWDEVRALRREAERYALAGDVLAAAMLDRQASMMAERLQLPPRRMPICNATPWCRLPGGHDGEHEPSKP